MTSTGPGRSFRRPVALLVVVVAATLAATVSVAAQSSPAQPDIVVVYVDDFPQHTTQLWSDPARTPALARFTAEGTWFSGATGSTPICCPGRAATFTGQWSHHHGVISNDMGPFDPSDTIATRLQDVGYHTTFTGKYLNRFERYAPTTDDVEPYTAGWDDFDALWSNQGRYYDYRMWTRDGVRDYADRPADHSTRVITEQAVERIREAPADQPLFAFVSLVDGHKKNLPMPEFVGDPRCQEMEPFAGPAYDEPDVSDKPAYVQDALPLAEPAYDLTTRCEEMLGVDWATQQLFEAIEARGRTSETIFVFTIDNGYLIGEHGLEGKVFPYATPVPLYVLWPERWAEAPRIIEEPVSNVDVAPTLCALAGCELQEPDGLSLLPLLDGTGTLERPFIYEENLLIRPHKPAWVGLRTTPAWSAETTWVYTEYSTGEVELYDLGADPWQLENVARDESYAPTRDALRDLLHASVLEPNGVTFVAGGTDDDD